MHKQVTNYTIDALPSWERKIFGSEGRRFLEEASVFPDCYFDTKCGGYEKARPYAFFVDGIQFHYIPNTPLEPRYRFWKVVTDQKGKPLRLARIADRKNPNWEHTKRGFHFYLSQAVEHLQKKNIKDFCGFLGTFLHVLQDGSTFLHSLEGIDGTDIFILDRLIDPPEGNLSLLPSSLLCEKDALPTNLNLPVLLGTSVAEVAFLLYSRFYKAQVYSRKRLIPLLESIYEGNTKKTEQLSSEIVSNCIQLCADVTHTIFCLAFKKFLQRQVKALERVYLSELKPIWEPAGLSLPYRFITMVKDHSLDENCNLHPLQLVINEKGRKKLRTFRKGLGTGCHYEYTIAYELPANVYETFSTAVGLHAKLGKGGNVKVKIKLQGKTLFHQHFTDGHPAQQIEIPVRKGGLLELVVTSEMGTQGKHNNLVWGNPVLIK